jgi:hypothetical protein
MSFANFCKKYQLVLFLSFIVVIMTIIKITYKPEYPIKPNQTVNNISPIPTEISNIIPTEASKTSTLDLKNTASDSAQGKPYSLEKLLPYKGKNFTIVRYTKPQVLEVKVVVTDLNDLSALKEVETNVKKFLSKNKIDPETYQFEWNFDYQPN